MPDIRYLAEQRENVLAIVLTHAHEDHIGAVAQLWPLLRCPIYATPFTAKLLEDKLAEAGLCERVRDHSCAARGQDRDRSLPDRLHLHHPFHSRTQCARHSHAVRRRRPHRRLEARPRSPDRDRDGCERLAARSATMVRWRSSAIPPTRSFPDESGSEARVRQSLIDLIGTLSGRVAVTAFASNVARLESARRGCTQTRTRTGARRSLDASDRGGGARDRLSERFPDARSNRK